MLATAAWYVAINTYLITSYIRTYVQILWEVNNIYLRFKNPFMVQTVL